MSEYKNAPAHSDWPHVDNFAAARQQSFDLATGDYCFWCDTDDILLQGAEQIREHATRGGHAAFVFPYAIHGKGLAVPRERMLLKGSGQWRSAVHEYFEFKVQPVQAIEDERVIVQHLPALHHSTPPSLHHSARPSSNTRNLRILRSLPDSELTTGLLYHLHLELALANDIPASIDVARRVLARPDLGKPEKMEIFINLAQVTEDPNAKQALFHQAYAADPRRREPLLMLCNNALNFDEPAIALAFARQMLATPRPAMKEWNERAAIYGWLGDDIYAQALRANGHNLDAEIVRQERFQKEGGPRIALVHATRGRCVQAALARKVWLDTAAQPERVEHLFIFDTDDQDSHGLRRFPHLELPAGGGCVAAWNAGAAHTAAPVLVQMSDDWTPPQNWDQLILDRLADPSVPSVPLPARVLAVSDGHRTDKLICLAIATRAYVLQDHYFFHPRFTGVYSDNHFTDVAYGRNQVIEARDLVFTHNHPIFGNAGSAGTPAGEPLPVDDTYARQNSASAYLVGKFTYDELSTHPERDWSSVPGFFNFYIFYDAIARRLTDGDTVAEVGVWMGRSIIYLAQLLKRQGKQVKLLAVDTFAGELNQPVHEAAVAAHGGSLRAVFEANVKRCGVADMIEIIEGDSAASSYRVPDASLAFCFIDAAHDYDSVKRDVLAWQSKVKPTGVFAGHDAQHEPVMMAVREIIPDVRVTLPCWMVVSPESGTSVGRASPRAA
ncbi:MAG: class I SAM-dependent methyltransferase [Chthoniobacteraceae bacterium]|nr:class I SAM-dependent methyltransferase [Chthoniobacteraceae bacterium]